MTDVYDQETDVQYEEFPEPRSPRSGRWLRVLLALSVVVLLVLAGVGLWVNGEMNPGDPGDEIAITIPRGSTTAQIAAILDDRGVISNARLFRMYVRFKGNPEFQAGNYTMRENSDYGDVLKVLGKGAKAESHRLTIPEGLTLRQIADRVGRLPGRSSDRFLELANSGKFRSPYSPPGNTNLEGLLYPSTYELKPTDDEAVILQKLIDSMAVAGAQVGLDDAQAKVGLTPYEVIIVASMIEREARIESERGMVARVVYNRLEKGWKLGIDATIRYGVNRHTEPLRKSDLARDNPYNTRLRAGLPPTPIAAPGQATLHAALNPTPGPWMYYVLADQSGRHTFATTDAEFQRAVQECRRKNLC